MMIALLVIALPVGVVGANFNKLYEDHLKSEWNALDITKMEVADMEALFREIDNDGSGYIDEKEFTRKLREKGMT